MFLVETTNDSGFRRGFLAPLEVESHQWSAAARTDRTAAAEIDFQSPLLLRSAIAGRAYIGKPVRRQPRNRP
jgi:hypothetical protein